MNTMCAPTTDIGIRKAYYEKFLEIYWNQTEVRNYWTQLHLPVPCKRPEYFSNGITPYNRGN